MKDPDFKSVAKRILRRDTKAEERDYKAMNKWLHATIPGLAEWETKGGDVPCLNCINHFKKFPGDDFGCDLCAETEIAVTNAMNEWHRNKRKG